MINSKEDLKNYIRQDFFALGGGDKKRQIERSVIAEYMEIPGKNEKTGILSQLCKE